MNSQSTSAPEIANFRDDIRQVIEDAIYKVLDLLMARELIVFRRPNPAPVVGLPIP